MAYEKRTPRHDWRSHLTDDERMEVEEIDAAIAVAKDGMARLSPIRNRAIQRCRYVEKIERERVV